MTPRDEERLMQYADGELAADEVAAVDALLARSTEARALLDDFDRVGHLVRSNAEARAATFDIADEVLARIAPSRPALTALPGGGGGVDSRRIRRWVEGAGLLAAAAAVAFIVRHHGLAGPSPLTSASATAEVARGGPEGSSAAVESGSEPESGASIESVDFGARNGTIFMVATGPQVTPVVWLMDEGESGEDGVKPL